MNEQYPGLHEFIIMCINKGLSTEETYDLAERDFGYENSLSAFRKMHSKIKVKNFSRPIITNPFKESKIISEDVDESIEKQFIDLLKRRKIVSGDEICRILNCTPKDVYELTSEFRKKGYEIYCDDKKVIFGEKGSDANNNIDTLETDEIIFGVASDIHFGSNHCQITHLNSFAEICRKKGVKNILVPGDVFSGYNVYAGQAFEVYALSAREQEESAIVNLPTGFEWYVLGGNHDYSFIKRGGGHNPLLVLENKRDDVHYVGFDEADIPLLPGVDCRLWHPSGGLPYSVSYRMQKAVEQISYSELAKVVRNQKTTPSIRFLLCGHLHIQVQAMFGSIFAAQCGTFEGQTTYLKTHGLHPIVGGYIIRAGLRKKDGMILNFDAKFYMFPEEIENDWKNYNHTLPEAKKLQPIFS